MFCSPYAQMSAYLFVWQAILRKQFCQGYRWDATTSIFILYTVKNHIYV